MRLLRFTFPIALLTILFFSCQKNETDPEIDPDTGCTNCSSSNSVTYYAILKSGVYIETSSSTQTVTNRASAFFSSQPINLANSNTMVNVNLAQFNGDSLKNSGPPLYYTNENPINLATEQWYVDGGSSGIPTFNFNNINNKPAYATISNIPDSISAAVGFSFTVHDISYMTAGSAIISDGKSSNTKIFSVPLKSGTDTISFSSQNLLSFSTGTTAYVSIVLENSQIVKIDGKDIKISKEKAYTKYFKLKP
ncbi:MAG: hypothetical protein AB7O73_12120 [Bacteroidia bacterium]